MASSLFRGQNQSQQISPQIINQAKAMMNNAGTVRQLMNMLGGKGLNPEQAVRTICQWKGINVDEFMSQLE